MRVPLDDHVVEQAGDAAGLFDGPAEVRTLPRYPWSRQSYWVERTSEGVELADLVGDHELLGFQRRAGESVWFNHVSTGRQAWLADHQVNGRVVVPGAALVELAVLAQMSLLTTTTSSNSRIDSLDSVAL